MNTNNNLKKQLEEWISEERCIATLMMPGCPDVTGIVVDISAAMVTLQESDRGGVVFRSYPLHNIYRIEYGLRSGGAK